MTTVHETAWAPKLHSLMEDKLSLLRKMCNHHHHYLHLSSKTRTKRGKEGGKK